MSDITPFLPKGYRFAGLHAGIRRDPSRRDLALIVSDVPAAAAGVFTQNRVVAAPVQVSRRRVPSSEIRGVVICSGNANACTGAQGQKDAEQMACVAAESIGCKPEQMLVCSTGVIGRTLPMQIIEPGIRRAAESLRSDPESFQHVAKAILTTDTRIKMSFRQVRVGEQLVAINGAAKGAAMIGPNLATMLAFIITDATIAPAALQALLREAVDRSFNCISVEGHTSTNDSVLLFANGAAGASPLGGKSLADYSQAVTEVCEELARAIAEDAEGITHLVRIDVEGLRTVSEARQVAKTVAESALVKTAIFGGDPNWGRIVSAAGYAGVDFEEKNLSLWIGDQLLYQSGVPQPFDEANVSSYIKGSREVLLRLVFDLGQECCRFWTSDLSYEYVRLNAEYTT